MENLKIINEKRLIENISYFGNKKICAMVKCNAYGHGLKEIVSAAEEHVSSFGVVSAYEGKQVRKYTDKPIIIWSVTEDFSACKKYALQFVVDDEKDIRKAVKLNIEDSMHLKINCGMNRFGVKSEIDGITLNSISTHFPITENKRETLKNYQQFLRLKSIITQNASVCFGGSGIYDYNFNFQILRLGIGMYGYGHKNLKGVLRLKSYVKKVFFARRGETVGYSAGYTVQKDGFFAVVPVGYGDGLRRALSGNFYVKINNKKMPAVGNICMDCFFVKVDKNVNVGDEVEVFWDADKFAKICGNSARL